MADDKTQTLNGNSFEERVLAQLAAIDARLSSLEVKVDDRMRETRPIWEKALAEIMAVGDRLSSVESEIATLNHQAKETNVRLAEMNERFGAIAEDMLSVRGKQKYFEKKLLEIEEDRQPH